MSATGLTVSGERTTGDSIRTQNGNLFLILTIIQICIKIFLMFF